MQRYQIKKPFYTKGGQYQQYGHSLLCGMHENL